MKSYTGKEIGIGPALEGRIRKVQIRNGAIELVAVRPELCATRVSLGGGLVSNPRREILGFVKIGASRSGMRRFNGAKAGPKR